MYLPYRQMQNIAHNSQCSFHLHTKQSQTIHIVLLNLLMGIFQLYSLKKNRAFLIGNSFLNSFSSNDMCMFPLERTKHFHIRSQIIHQVFSYTQLEKNNCVNQFFLRFWVRMHIEMIITRLHEVSNKSRVAGEIPN